MVDLRWLVCDGAKSGEFFAEEEFEGGAATGGNEGVMKVFVVCHEVFDKAGGVAAANDGGGLVCRFFANHLSGDGAGGGVGGIFGVA